jgi:hypothetical protein
MFKTLPENIVNTISRVNSLNTVIVTYNLDTFILVYFEDI